MGAVTRILLSSGVSAGEPDSLSQTCSACHGNTAVTQAGTVPIISGQPFTVIQDALILFADDKRPCTVMCTISAALGSSQMEALANYFELQAFVPADQESDPVLASLGAELHVNHGCETCHSQGGRNGHGMAPILAGQWTPYLREALLQIQTGRRSGPAVMNAVIRSWGRDEIEALLNFYARKQD